MKYLYIYLISVILVLPAFAEYSLPDMARFKNDKEVLITSFSKRQRQRIERMPDLKDRAAQYSAIFSQTMLNFMNFDGRKCDLRLIHDLKKSLQPKESFTDFLMILRVENHIDDILFSLLYENFQIDEGLSKIDLKKKAKNVSGSTEELLKKNDIEEIFASVKNVPDEETSCLLSEYIYIFDEILNEDGRPAKNLKAFRKLLKVALDRKIISLETYHKLSFLSTETKLHERDIWLNDYFKIIFNAKNKMIPIKNSYVVKDIKLEDDFASEKIKRFSRITRRRLLYRKYNETQIVLLSQLLQKASRRMGADPDTISKAPVISQEFSVLNENGERENYVETFELDPQSQYNLARRLLRKDMTELQMMDIFLKVNITHEDIVMAALETGYISLGDLEYVVTYDDLWNPVISKFERVTGFIFRTAGYVSFFLPPPWNVTATIALSIAEGVVDNRIKNGVDNDNPSTFIE